MSEELKACPFCGGEGVVHGPIYIESAVRGYGVSCTNCHVQVNALDTVDYAIAAWNLRTPDWRALAQELATALGKFVGYTLSGDVYYFSPETHDLLARARKAGLEVGA